MCTKSLIENDILRRLQLTEVEILKEVVRICKENKLQYFLIGGTLLGAIRHKGFIPWDDDLDIAMPRKDYEKILKLFETQLNSKYYLHSNKTDSRYWLPFVKVRKNETIFEEKSIRSINTHKGIYIDIFPLDNANRQKSFIQDIQAKIVKRISNLVIQKRGLNVAEPGLVTKIILNMLKPIKLQSLTKFQTKVMSYNGGNDSEYHINLGSNYNYIKQTIPKEKYYPPVKVEFEGDFYNAPNDWDFILKRIYGDYMKLPPIEKRITHNPTRIKFEYGEDIKFEN